MEKQPIFITFEGGEGAGKSTLIQRVKEWFEQQGLEVVVTREPGGGPLGEAIRKLILESSAMAPMTELLLFLAARAQHIEEKILPALIEKKVLLCDRYSDSTLAYQGYARGLGVEALVPLCRLATGGIEPSLTFYLDISPEIGLARAKGAIKQEKSDRMEAEKEAFHHKVREGFLELAKLHPERIHTIDASQIPDKVFDEVIRVLTAH